MMYAINIYGEAGAFDALPKEEQKTLLDGHGALQDRLGKRGEFVTVKLMPPAAAVRVEPAPSPDAQPLIVDGPFAETKESFLGFYAAEFTDLEDALDHARMISSHVARLEVRPIAWAGGALSTG